LVRDSQLGEERIDYLFKTLDLVSCGSAGKSRRNLYDLYRALYEEGYNIADNEKLQKRADGLKSWADAVIKSRNETGPMIIE
jgi:hypothetical protein